MKKKLEIQTVLVLLFVLGVAGAWIGIQVTRDSLGLFSERSELQFETGDLLGLGPRSELRCSGALIGHVRRVIPAIGDDGKARFTLIAGVRNDYAAWTFRPVGLVKAGLVQAALAPAAVQLELSKAPDAVQAVDPRRGRPPTLALQKEQSNNDLSDVAAQYRALGNEIDRTIRQFTEPQDGRAKSVMEEFAESVPAAASAIQQLETIAASLSGQGPVSDLPPEKRTPVERLVINLDGTTANLQGLTANLDKSLGEGGQIQGTLQSVQGSLVRLQSLIDELSVTVSNVNRKTDVSLGKVNSLLDETTDTMGNLNTKVERFGETFMGRMLISKPEPSPTPKKR